MTNSERSDVVIHTLLDKSNPQGTDRALFGALANLTPGRRRRFIYTTGCSIFGKVAARVMDETTEPNPEHPLAFRRTLEREALATNNVDVTVLRPGFMYGNDGYNSVSTDWFALAESGDAVFRGDKERGWSWIHIADLAEAYRLVVETEANVGGEIFHLGDKHQPLSLDVMRACLAAAGYTGDVRFEGPKKGDNVSSWFNQNEFVTSEKAHRMLGWSPRHAGILADARTAYASWKAARSSAS